MSKLREQDDSNKILSISDMLTFVQVRILNVNACKPQVSLYSTDVGLPKDSIH